MSGTLHVGNRLLHLPDYKQTINIRDVFIYSHLNAETHKRLYHELQHHTVLCQRHADTFHGQSDLLGRIREYLSGDAQSPMVLHGATGSGKTALAAMAVKLCGQVLPHSACVVRFVGATPESSTPNQLLRSACEQIAYLYGEHMSVASKVNY